MPLTRTEHIQIRQAIALMTGHNLMGDYHISREHVEILLDKYTEDFVNSLNEDSEPVKVERE